MDKQQTQEAGQPANTVPNTHFATLVRGESYTLGNVVFRPGKRVPVPKYIKDHLEKTAVDMVDVEGVAEEKAKFAFEDLDSVKDIDAPRATAARRRAPARAEQE